MSEKEVSGTPVKFVNWLGVLTVVLTVAKFNPFGIFDADVVDFQWWIVLATGALSVFTILVGQLSLMALLLFANLNKEKK